MYATGKEFERQYSPDLFTKEFITKKYKRLAIVLGIGIKIVIKKRVPLDIYFGIGTFSLSNEAVTRGGTSLGYRFNY